MSSNTDPTGRRHGLGHLLQLDPVPQVALAVHSHTPLSFRSMNCMALRLPKQTWLFEAGEDSQRQLVQQPILNQGRVCRIFITSCDAHNLFGLPGGAHSHLPAHQPSVVSSCLPTT